MNNQQTNLCLFGGTFDPIHLGHTFIALKAHTELNLQKVIFLPCQKSPHKLHSQSASADDRYKMCKLATEKHPWADVSDYDILAPAPSYSWRTAEYFKQLYPNARLFWLMGTDQWQSISQWNRSAYFKSLVDIIVYDRGSNIITQSENDCISMHTYRHPASATAIRSAIKKYSQSGWLNPKVHNYIIKNNLYSTST